jgi:hypothetical protein
MNELDSSLEAVLRDHDRNGASKNVWFLLAVVAVRALIQIAGTMPKRPTPLTWADLRNDDPTSMDAEHIRNGQA